MIHLQGLGKTYGLYRHGFDRLLEAFTGRRRHQEVVALHPLDLHVGQGEIVGLIGKNGAGKSTLLKLVSGMIQPSSGSIEVNGKVVPLLELGTGFHPEMTGHDNLFMAGAAMGLDRAFIEAEYDNIVNFSEIGHFIHMPVKTYSSGMFVRLAFSLATCVHPDILIIDEALSVGDGAFARKSFDRIMSFRDAGVTILFCSHSLYQVEVLCDRVAWMKDGKLVMDGDAAEVVSRYNEWLNGVDNAAQPQHEQTPRIAEGVLPVAAGSGQVTLRRLEALADGVPGTDLKLKSKQSELRLRAVFASDPNLPVPSFAMAIKDMEGRMLASAGTRNDGLQVSRDETGIASVELVFPRIPLLKGRYTLDVYLLCENGLHLYEAAEGGIMFEVTQEGLEQGVVSLHREWVGLT